MKQWFRTLKQMWKYHQSIDVERALRQRLWDGIQIGRKEVNKKPYCDLHNNPEFDPPLVVIGGGLFGCPQCRQISEPVIPVRRPTIRLVEPPTERPLLDYLHKTHPEEGPDTSMHRAVHLPSGQTGGIRKIGG